jgi:NAD(P)-dependent dehydrogenase (short-subunit alcohol dehydrogenase family)
VRPSRSCSWTRTPALFVELDVTEEAASAGAVETATAWDGSIDILGNDAGIGHVKPLASLSIESFDADRTWVAKVLGFEAPS